MNFIISIKVMITDNIRLVNIDKSGVFKYTR